MANMTPLGWNVDSFTPHKWIIPNTDRHLVIHPIYGYILIVWAIWYNRVVERINPVGNEPWDEWGYARRKNRNSPTWSEHGGCASDLNATLHPNGVPVERTFTSKQLRQIRFKVRLWNRLAGATVIRHGVDYQNTPDGMHNELYYNPKALKRLMRTLSRTWAGKQAIKANPAQCNHLKREGYLR